MSTLLAIVLTNAASALLLALGAAAAQRVVRRPAVIHALWALVLLKLFSPPLVEIGLLPQERVPREVARASAPPPADLARDARTVTDVSAAMPAPARPGIRDLAIKKPELAGVVSRIAALAWLAGAAAVLGLAVHRALRFGRLVAEAQPVDPALGERAGKLAASMGLGSCPALRLVSAPISPMVWSLGGSPRLLLPRGLLGRLTSRERDTLIAHELAHVARKDHWLRYLELASLAVFWWHPVTWWARRGLRDAEEQCCDDLVVERLPGHARDYAEGLLKTLEFLATSRARSPVLASALSKRRNLEERLTMIMQDPKPRLLSNTQRLALLVVALAVIAVFPTRAEQTNEWSGGHPAGVTAEDEQAFRREILELQRRSTELEAEMRQIHARQREIQHSWESARMAREIDRLRAEAAGLEAEGQRDDALRLRNEAERHERRVELEKRRAELERERVRSMGDLELELRQSMLEVEERTARGEEREADELRERVAALEAELEQRQLDLMKAEGELEQAAADADLEMMQRELEQAERRGEAAERQRLENGIRMLRAERSLAAAHRQLYVKERVLAREAQVLEKRMQALVEQGRHEEAQKLEARVLELRAQADESAQRTHMMRLEAERKALEAASLEAQRRLEAMAEADKP